MGLYAFVVNNSVVSYDALGLYPGAPYYGPALPIIGNHEFPGVPHRYVPPPPLPRLINEDPEKATSANEAFWLTYKKYRFGSDKTRFVFSNDHPWTIALKEHLHVELTRLKIDTFVRGKCCTSDPYDGLYGPRDASYTLNKKTIFENAVMMGRDIQAALGLEDAKYSMGSFGMTWEIIYLICNPGIATVQFKAEDTLRLESHFRIPGTSYTFVDLLAGNIGGEPIPIDNIYGDRNAPYNSVKMIWSWYEIIHF